MNYIFNSLVKHDLFFFSLKKVQKWECTKKKQIFIYTNDGCALISRKNTIDFKKTNFNVVFFSEKGRIVLLSIFILLLLILYKLRVEKFIAKILFVSTAPVQHFYK